MKKLFEYKPSVNNRETIFGTPSVLGCGIEFVMIISIQNPIEQEGTYPLPEAQVDRFMLKLKIDYPNREEEREIIITYEAEAEGMTSEDIISKIFDEVEVP